MSDLSDFFDLILKLHRKGMIKDKHVRNLLRLVLINSNMDQAATERVFGRWEE